MKKFIKIAILVLVYGLVSFGMFKIVSAAQTGFGPAKLRVVKHVVGGPATAGQFIVQITGASATPSIFHPSESGTDVTLTPFSHYSVQEKAYAGYTPSYSPDCSGISVNEFHPKTCTITNTWNGVQHIKPKLTLLKTVINNNGGTKVAADFQAKIDGFNVGWGTTHSGNPGVHHASEVNLPGYTAGVWGGDCLPGGGIILAWGDNKTCTITNDDVAHPQN